MKPFDIVGVKLPFDQQTSKKRPLRRPRPVAAQTRAGAAAGKFASFLVALDGAVLPP
jgi:hypothetical protein